ncbi:hypothetical protein [Polymorphobacter multimanifer]|uniref:Heme/copper-type cytochrome/quinol oxidase subunit 2 n=1 Tax=Polymorphobacter multimanifer TaxID=1070431 RepID=A0A841L837_9SPHN|nr:hypothetical protein [Polymorphobacter multimanifer]MBB6228366.1 heme/copper-type cytochrome/quinol oxidase subunit 2 [Polymorphobacter multimanifer]
MIVIFLIVLVVAGLLVWRSWRHRPPAPGADLAERDGDQPPRAEP